MTELLWLAALVITGENPLTAAAVAAGAGVDDLLAEATAEDMLEVNLPLDRLAQGSARPAR